MINKITDFFENFSKHLGLSIKLPRPGKKGKRTAAVTNGLIGFGLVASGVALKKAGLTLLGAAGIVSAILLTLDE